MREEIARLIRRSRSCQEQEVTRRQPGAARSVPRLHRSPPPVAPPAPAESRMTRTPDEDYDVIVHQFRQLGTNGAGLDTWTVWLGGEKLGERATRASAIELACDVAAACSRPAWAAAGWMRRGTR